MTDEDFKKIGDEMVRVLEPVYTQLDRMEQKQDAQTADIMELQKKADTTNDRIVTLDEKITNHIKAEREELSEIREHVNLPLIIRDNP